METLVSESNVLILKSEDTNKHSKVNSAAIKKAAMTLRAINHKLRQQIIKLIDENKRIRVTDIYKRLNLDQSTASQHLAALRRSNVVTTERSGRIIYYSINHDRISSLSMTVNKLVHGREEN